MTDHSPIFEFIQPESEFQSLTRRVILGYADHEIQMKLPIRPTGFAYFTYSRYPQDLMLHYSNDVVKSEGKLGLANQILREHPYFDIDGKFFQIGIELFPHMPYCLFGLAGTRLLNQIYVLPPEDPEIRVLAEELDALEEPNEVARTMQQYLWEKSKQVEIRHDIVNMLNDIYESNGQILVSDLAERHQISTRHIQRLFRNYIGLTPKQYSMVIQFNHVQQKFIDGTTRFENYHDQAHFTKICKRITGFTPLELMKLDNGFLSGYLK